MRLPDRACLIPAAAEELAMRRQRHALVNERTDHMCLLRMLARCVPAGASKAGGRR